jgi:hypothetical protein
MSLMTRAVTAVAVLSLAAIPVAALTIKNTSSNGVSIAVDNGTDEKVYQIPAGSSVDVTEDCSSDCAVTGPWGYSRLLSQNDTLETDGGSLVTADATPAQSLVPQNPVTESADGTDGAASTAPADAKPAVKRKRIASKPRKQAQKGPASGSFQMLFQGPGK